MMLLEIKPKIIKFDSCKNFIEDFSIGHEDLIFTNKFLYNTFLKEFELRCSYIFQEDYNLREPSDDIIDKIIKEISSKNLKRVIAIGGGSIIDISKLLALKEVEKVSELFEKKVSAVKNKELIIIPTTCGTGSEVTNISIAEIKSKKTKMGLAVPELYADYAVLIPELVKGLPYEFFVYSSIDALIHAMESLVSPKANQYTEMYSKEAIKMIIGGYKKIIEKGKEYRIEIIEDFLIASNYAGISFGNAGVGAVHALSYPLGAKYHVPHGEANYEFFIEVFKCYNKKNPEGKIKYLNALLSELLEVKAGEDVYSSLEMLLANLIKRKNLKEYGMGEKDIEEFTENVINTQQRLLANNYVKLSKEEILQLYKSMY
ncbi:MAG: 4-hydroxybutyrate dehydrogenase [Clostridium argentinense]|uniref:4-hydroxybutyrate dehydrogenase n=1 Tax=Clostridium faecium TaxID=2762223 RepID=A0ABR8YQM2_9CLOT|nr:MULTISPECIES: 4-hydroxybutyrate dehydrogenase [Clostridium]MBD8046562.1 4-hydroxybutyrate dehydrogenase [Clostridium faecium]MBS5822749.1 4-hydroxybutyrate dehydrogenase [Clostridium argentinense]MDU1348105.1 4-hydroxybutyrate dehydrogenase [Clostridium argentinense]